MANKWQKTAASAAWGFVIGLAVALGQRAFTGESLIGPITFILPVVLGLSFGFGEFIRRSRRT